MSYQQEPFGPNYQPQPHDQPTQHFGPPSQAQAPAPSVPLSAEKRHRNAIIIWLVGASFLLVSNTFCYFVVLGEVDDATTTAVRYATTGIALVLANCIGTIALTGIVHMSLRLAKKA